MLTNERLILMSKCMFVVLAYFSVCLISELCKKTAGRNIALT